MSTTYYSGTTGDLTLASVALLVSSWKFTDEAAEADTTTVGSAGFHTLTTTKRSGSGECEAFFDGAITYGTSPPIIRTGSTGTFTFAVSTASGAPSITGTAVVVSVDYTHDLEGVFKYSLKFKTSGAYKVPGES